MNLVLLKVDRSIPINLMNKTLSLGLVDSLVVDLHHPSMSIGSFFRLARHCRNYSQEYVARSCEISQETISRIESDLSRSLEPVAILCSFYELDISAKQLLNLCRRKKKG
jgi:DNA-binding XRE family transcriptional regulator